MPEAEAPGCQAVCWQRRVGGSPAAENCGSKNRLIGVLCREKNRATPLKGCNNDK